MKSIEEWVRELIRPGTPQCAVLSGILGVVLALFFIFLGFWQTVFVVLLCAIGVFLGGVKDKSACIKAVVNRLFPPKDK